MKGKKLLLKTLGFVCAAALVFGTVFVPIDFSAAAANIPVTDDESVTFTFSEAEGSVLNQSDANNMTRGNDGIGCASWGLSVIEKDGATGIGKYHGNKVTYSDMGGYRLNNKNGVYYLEENATYIVSLKLRVASSPKSFEKGGVKKNENVTSVLRLGYGFTNAGKGNTVSDMKKVLYEVVTTSADSNKAVLTDSFGSKTVDTSKDFHELNFVFTAPSDFKEYNNALGFYIRGYYGTQLLINDVTVTKLGNNTGVVTLVDDYYGKKEFLKGKIGEAASLPTLKATEEAHKFLGWYTDAERKTEAKDIKFAEANQILYSKWLSPVKVTFVDKYLATEDIKSGITGEKLEINTKLSDSENKKNFIGWYTTESFTEEFTENVFPNTDLTLYARWEDAKTDFNSYPYTSDHAVFDHKSQKIVKSDGIGFNDGSALLWEYKGDKIWNSPNELYCDRSKAGKIQDHRTKLSLLKDKTTYEITYYVNVKSANTDFDISFATGSRTDIWGKGFNLYAGTKNTVSKSAAVDEWVKHTVILNTDFKDKNANALYMILNVNNGEKQSEVNAYIDEITVNEFKGGLLIFNPSIKIDGEWAMQRGNAGDKIVFPEYTSDISTLLGWYTDKECTIPFTDTVLGEGVKEVYAKWSEAPTLIEFEGYEFSNNSSIFATQSMSIVKADKAGYKDSSALYWNYKGNKEWKKDVLFSDRNEKKDHKALLDRLDNNSTYKITYYVKENNANANYDISFASGHPGNIWNAGFKVYETSVVHIKKGTNTGEWVKKEAVLTTDFGNEKANWLYLILQAKAATKDTSVELYVDRIAIEKLSSDVLIFDPCADIDTAFQTGKAGDTIVFPEYKNGSAKFLGWYADAGYKTPFNEKTMAAGVKTVYAKWGDAPISFKDYKYFSSNRLQFGVSMSIVNEKNAGYDDDYKLSYHLDGEQVRNIDSKGKPVYMKDRVKMYQDSAAMIDKLKNNTAYKISYYYKAGENSSHDADIIFLTADSGNVYNKTKTYSYTKKNVSLKDTDWKYAETYLFTDFSSEFANMLYIAFAGHAQSGSDGMDIKVDIDNVLVEELSDELIVFHPCIKNVETSFQTGKIGEPIVFPELNNDSAKFIGWYTDANYNTPFNGKTITEGVKELYAKWGSTSVNFKDYEYASSNRVEFGVSMSVVNAKGAGYDDDYKLRFHLDGEQVRNIDSKGKPVYMKTRVDMYEDNAARIMRLKNNTVYKISYYFKAGENSSHDADIMFLTADSGNVYNNTRHYDYTVNSVALKETGWQYAETYLCTDLVSEKGNMLFIAFAGDAKKGSDGIDIKVDVDNVLVEEVEKPYVFFDGLNKSFTSLVKLAPGEKITFPADPVKVGYKFKGWFLDKDAEIPFTADSLKANEMAIAYAGYVKDNHVLYDFEEYNFPNPNGWHIYGNYATVGKHGIAASGVQSLRVERIDAKLRSRTSYAIVGHDVEHFTVDKSKKYVVKFKYYVEKRGRKNLEVGFNSAFRKNAFEKSVSVTEKFKISPLAETGVWKTKALIIDPAKIADGKDALFIMMKGGDKGIFYFDDIEITTLPEGHIAYVVDNDDVDSVPLYVSGPVGSSFANKLPAAPKKANHKFLGYLKIKNGKSEELSRKDMVFGEDKITVKASFVRLVTKQDFESDYIDLLNTHADYTTLDFDWEHYDALAKGNSRDNVTSGRYSIHRKGNTYFFENAQVLTDNLRLTPGERYVITMKVKAGKSLQNNGAIKIGSCKSAYYPWDVTGDYFAVAAVKDLKQDEWQEIKYVFTAVEPYLSIQTPGYFEVFVDDIVLKRVEKDVPVSEKISYTEYVPVKRDEQGNEIGKSAFDKDVTSIIDSSLSADPGVNILPFIIMGAAVIVVGAAAAVIVLVVKKRRKNTKI